MLIESDVDHSGRDLHFRNFWSPSNDGEVLTMIRRDNDIALSKPSAARAGQGEMISIAACPPMVGTGLAGS